MRGKADHFRVLGESTFNHRRRKDLRARWKTEVGMGFAGMGGWKVVFV